MQLLKERDISPASLGVCKGVIVCLDGVITIYQNRDYGGISAIISHTSAPTARLSSKISTLICHSFNKATSVVSYRGIIMVVWGVVETHNCWPLVL